MDQWDLLQEIWDQDLMDLPQMVWVICIHIWMMQELTMDQLMDQWDLLLMQTWTVMEWLHHPHPMILLMM